MRIGRVIAILVGLALTGIGLLTMLSTGAGLLLVGFDNTLDTGSTDFESPTAAIAADVENLGDEDIQDRVYNDETAKIRIEASGDQDLFIGVGPTDQVRAYLDQAPWDEFEALSTGRFDTSGSKVEYERRGGAEGPDALPAPTDQDFWVEQQTGTRVDLQWEFEDGDHSIVLMNADGSPEVKADGELELKIPRLTLALIIGLVIGLVLLLVGLLFLFRIGRRRNPSYS